MGGDVGFLRTFFASIWNGRKHRADISGCYVVLKLLDDDVLTLRSKKLLFNRIGMQLYGDQFFVKMERIRADSADQPYECANDGDEVRSRYLH